MNKTFRLFSILLLSSAIIMTGCGRKEETQSDAKKMQTEAQSKKEKEQTKGQELTNVLGDTNWQGTKVYDKDNNDLTSQNMDFIGLAKYDADTARYEFFDKETKASRGDMGTFFITNDGTKRVMISESKGYQSVVDITELNEDTFTYKRMGKDAAGNDIEVFVDHIPYDETELAFTSPDKDLTTTTGTIVTDEEGASVLASTPWQGTVVLDQAGNDVSSYNSNFLGLAKYDDKTNKYEFFDAKTGASRGDFGYYDVLNENKVRAHVSLGQNKYGAVLELTELNDEKFTYKRMGKDATGAEIPVTVEHEPYEGDFDLEFTN